MKGIELQISESKLLSNYNYFKGFLKPTTKVMVALKANAYGLGDLEVGRVLEKFGVDYLAVAFPAVGVKLREGGIKLPILILTPGSESFQELIEYNLEPSIMNFYSLQKMEEAVAAAGKESYPIHIKLDSGMQRVGFNKEEIPALKERLYKNRLLKAASIFSHLAAADNSEHDSFTRGQIELFKEMSSSIIDRIGYSPIRHILNSVGVERFSEAQFDMVRLGMGLYGTNYTDGRDLHIPFTLKAPVIHIRDTNQGSIGYGRVGKADPEGSRVVIISGGYADGISRALGNGNWSCILNGVKVPTVGIVNMDSFAVDAKGVDVQIGDSAIIFSEELTPDDMAKVLGTIPYEVIARLGVRIKRTVVP